MTLSTVTVFMPSRTKIQTVERKLFWFCFVVFFNDKRLQHFYLSILNVHREKFPSQALQTTSQIEMFCVSCDWIWIAKGA